MSFHAHYVFANLWTFYGLQQYKIAANCFLANMQNKTV